MKLDLETLSFSMILFDRAEGCQHRCQFYAGFTLIASALDSKPETKRGSCMPYACNPHTTSHRPIVFPLVSASTSRRGSLLADSEKGGEEKPGSSPYLSIWIRH
jgi:hypothetical protein